MAPSEPALSWLIAVFAPLLLLGIDANDGGPVAEAPLTSTESLKAP